MVRGVERRPARLVVRGLVFAEHLRVGSALNECSVLRFQGADSCKREVKTLCQFQRVVRCSGFVINDAVDSYLGGTCRMHRCRCRCGALFCAHASDARQHVSAQRIEALLQFGWENFRNCVWCNDLQPAPVVRFCAHFAEQPHQPFGSATSNRFAQRGRIAREAVSQTRADNRAHFIVVQAGWSFVIAHGFWVQGWAALLVMHGVR